MMTIIPAAMMLITLTSSTGTPAVPAASSQWRAEIAPSSQSDSARDARLKVLLQRLNERDRTQQTVFVVPGPDLLGEGLAEITEDMTVMCRIFDKALAPILAVPGMAIAGDVFGRRIYNEGPDTQGLYLDGYGALFFVEVGFPLVQPPQEQKQPETEHSTDPLWSQTVNELKGLPPEQRDDTEPAYDAQKVESLKSIVVKSLRHAANLRVRGAQDRVTVVITTRAASHAYASTEPRSTVWPDSSGGDSSDALVLSVTKADVDALAKGDRTLEQFTEKVKTLRSWMRGSGKETISTSITVPSSRPSSGVRQ